MFRSFWRSAMRRSLFVQTVLMIVGLSSVALADGPFIFSLQWSHPAPGDVVTDQAGNIYVVSAAGQQFRKYDPNGSFLLEGGYNGGGDGGFSSTAGIAVDDSGNIYV